MLSQIVFFDLDHTLLKRNSSFSFGLYLYKKKHISIFTLFRLFYYYALHKAGLIDIAGLHDKAFNCLFSGKSVSYFKSIADDFLHENFASLQNISTLIRYNDAKRKGHHVVILSSSPDFLVEAFARKFRPNSWQATEYHSHDDSWTKLGKVLEGRAKASHVFELSQKLLIPIGNTVGYSDSHLDLPFLESVGKPVAVNPTRPLLQIAKKRNWEILRNTSVERYSSVRRNYT